MIHCLILLKKISDSTKRDFKLIAFSKVSNLLKKTLENIFI